MQNPLIDIVESKYRRTSDLTFDVGDTARVTIKIVEGNKERLQDFDGTVIARKGRGLDEMFTVRRIVGDEGIERTFSLHSPKVMGVKIVRHGKIRRCKLYFLRERVGKARKLRERRISAEARRAAQEARVAQERARREADEAARAARQRVVRETTADAEMAPASS